MRTLPTLTIGILIGGAVFGSLGLLSAQAPGVVQQETGRYQIAGDAGNYLLDTTTGEVWAAIGAGDAKYRWEKRYPALQASVER